MHYAQELNEALAGTNYILNVHLKLDTGMTRIGFFAYDNDRDAGRAEAGRGAAASAH